MDTTDVENLAIRVVDSQEFGASRLVQLFTRKLALPLPLHPDDTVWREDLLKLIAKNMLFSLGELPSKSADSDTLLAESPDSLSRKERLLIQLIAQEKVIQKNLANKHLENKTAILYPFATRGTPSIEMFQAGLLTNSQGCPFGIEVFFDENHQAQLTKVFDKYDLKTLVVIGELPKGREKKIKALPLCQVGENALGERCVIIKRKIDEDELPTLRLACLHQHWPQINKRFKTVFLDYQTAEDSVVSAHLLLEMLSYYLQWQMSLEWDRHLQEQQNKTTKAWTLIAALERLKSIRSQTIQVEDLELKQIKSNLDLEQAEIISAFGISREEFYAD